MKNFAIYTIGFFAPLVVLVVLQNIWTKATRFDARLENGTIFMVDRRTGHTTRCVDQPSGELPVTCETLLPASID